jgi:hypothetical protein
MTQEEEKVLKTDHVFCGYCGTRMEEVLHPHPEFDRKTGKQNHVGSLYWQCPNRGIGIGMMYGDWMTHYDENPHNGRYLHEVTGTQFA